ncbi:MAG TPA: EAL domain-containing protein [Dongiaceae bacterium]|jgi:cyclic-di-GMP phosphodiesterase TipF (flagellum assembly factor)|nr:EAL domain-containing protein [Dongiaceae bacterium]
MSGFRAFLSCLIYVVPAALIALGLAPRTETLAPGMALVFGLLVLLGGAFVHLGYALWRARERADGEVTGALEAVAHLERVQRRLEGDLAQIRNALVDLQGRPEQNVGAVVAEVKVLQSLVERLYSARAGSPAPEPAPDAAATAGNGAPANGSAAQRAAAAMAANAAGGSLPMPPVAEGLDEQAILDLVREGLRENAVELALQPIVSLPQRKRRFYECYSRVRTNDGKIIVPEQYLDVAERHGLVTAIDNLLLFRCIQTLRRIRKSNANVGFFLNISPNTLADRGFFRDFIQLMAQNIELAPALVFEFPQRALAQADDSLWRDLDRLAQMGFRFSIDQVTDLDIDAATLSGRHFRFLKLEAGRVMEAARSGLFGNDPKLLKRTLDSYAIDLVIERIETEPMLLEVLDLHVDFGQGFLFGEPRIAKSDTPGALT